jgi:O-antigen/teichoic acid export membrane protein
MSDKSNKTPSLARRASIYTLSRAVTAIAQVLAAMLLARFLPKADAAVVLYLLAVYATLNTFGQLGLPDSVFYFFEKYGEARRKALCQLLAKLLFRLALAGAVVMLAIGWLGAMQEGFGQVRQLVWLFMAALLFELVATPLPNVLIAVGRSKAAAGLNVFVGISQFAALTLPLLTPWPVVGISVGMLAFAALRLLVSAALYRKAFGDEASMPLPEGTVRELLCYAVPMNLAQVFWALNREADKIVAQAFLPIALFAVYAVGAREIPIVPTIAYSVGAVMMPYLVSNHLKGDRAALLGLWLRGIRRLSVIVLPMVLVLLVLAEEFITLLFSVAYVEAALPFRIYTLIMLQRVASYSGMQRALGSTKTITWSAIWLFVVNIALSVPMVLWLGLAGPPVAAFLANMFVWWYSLNSIRSLLKADWAEVFPMGHYLKVLAIATLTALPVFLLKTRLDMAAELKFLLLATLYFILYAAVASALGFISREDWRRVLGAVRPSGKSAPSR